MGSPEVSPEPAWVPPEGVQRVPGGLEQESIEDPRVPLRQGIEGVGQGKHTVEIRDGQKVGQARFDPPRLGQRLTLGAMPIATRMVPGLIRAAVVALQQVPTEGGSPALLDRAHHPELLPSQRMRGAIQVSIGTENVGDFQRLPRTLGRGVPVAHRTRAPSAGLFQQIRRRRRLEQVLLRRMEIAQCRPYAGMAEQPLNGMEVRPRFQKMGRERVPVRLDIMLHLIDQH